MTIVSNISEWHLLFQMMKEWQAAREHVSEMRKTDNKQAEQLNKEITEVGFRDLRRLLPSLQSHT